MFTDGDIQMSFNFGEEILIIKRIHQNWFYSYLVGSSVWFVIIW